MIRMAVDGHGRWEFSIKYEMNFQPFFFCPRWFDQFEYALSSIVAAARWNCVSYERVAVDVRVIRIFTIIYYFISQV